MLGVCVFLFMWSVMWNIFIISTAIKSLSAWFLLTKANWNKLNLLENNSVILCCALFILLFFLSLILIRAEIMLDLIHRGDKLLVIMWFYLNASEKHQKFKKAHSRESWENNLEDVVGWMSGAFMMHIFQLLHNNFPFLSSLHSDTLLSTIYYYFQHMG